MTKAKPYAIFERNSERQKGGIMLKGEELNRINELAHKKKTEELSEEEQKEQIALRIKFLEDFRSRFKQQLDNIEIVDEDDPRLHKKKPS